MRYLLLVAMIILVVGQDDQYPDITVVGKQGVIDYLRKRTTDAIQAFAGCAGVGCRPNYTASPSEWSSKTVYSIVLDRFNNGDVENDFLNLPDYQSDVSGKKDLGQLPNYRMGGDIQGIRDRLPYLQSLGIGTIWISPVLEHDGSYHGYCTTNPLRIDAGFGTLDEYRQLVAESHSYGIRVVQDIVMDHICGAGTTYTKPAKHEECCTALMTAYKAGNSVESSTQGTLQFGPNFFPPLKLPAFYSRCGSNSGADWAGTEDCTVFGDFTQTMFDFNTGNFDFQEIYVEIFKYWMAELNVDGFRLDASKHITEDFIAYFSTEIRAFAKSIGKENFFVISEVSAPADWVARRLGNMMFNPSNPDDHDSNLPQPQITRVKQGKDVYLAQTIQKFPGPTAVYEFTQSGTARDALIRARPMKDIEDFFNSPMYNTVSGQTTYTNNWILVEIHDWQRLLFKDPNNAQRSSLGMGWLMSSPGTPIIYYGLEQGFNGRCDGLAPRDINGAASSAVKKLCEESSPDKQDAMKRQCMFQYCGWKLGSALSDIDKLKNITGNWEPESTYMDDPFLNQQSSLFKVAQRLIRLRKSCKALQTGKIYFRYSGTSRGDLLVYSRIVDGQEVVVFLNSNSQPLKLPAQIHIDKSVNQHGDVFLSALHRDVKMTVSETDSAVLNTKEITIDPNQFHIMIKESSSSYNQELDIALCA